MGQKRYAIYYVPGAKTPLATFGAQWLGRDVTANKAVAQPDVPGINAARLSEMTASARRYGFHATLKPPFHLAKNFDLEMLDEGLEAFAAAHRPFKIPPFEVAELDGFIALRPIEQCEDLTQLAKSCVREFDPFRAPASDKERNKRMQADLSDKQIKLLQKWGYPYVMSEFRFHLTLTERLKGKERKAVMAEVCRLTKDIGLGDETWMDAISLVRQKTPDHPFKLIKTYSFKAAHARGAHVKATQ